MLGELCGDQWCTTNSNNDMFGCKGGNFSGADVAGGNEPVPDRTPSAWGWRDRDDFLAVADEVFEVGGAPAQIVVELFPERIEGAQVCKRGETVFGVEVVEECKLRARVSEGGHILREGDLHASARQKHAAVPGKL